MSHNASYSHTGRTSNPPDAADSRLLKGRKAARPRARGERNFGTEEDRFYVGPKPTRNVTVARAAGSRRQQHRSARAGDRSYLGDVDDRVPNYPPPSFQEAISTPVASCYPSTVNLVPSPMSSLPPLVIPGSPGSPQASSTPVPRAGYTEGDSDSDDSLLLVDEEEAVPVGVDARLVRSVKRDYRNRRGIDFPSPTTPPARMEEGHLSSDIQTERGRPRLDLKAIYDAPDPAPRSPTIASPTRRFLSFSPLRAIFPSRSESPPPVVDRPHSAHPSPGASPYSHGGGKNSTFFRSTTSLATASFLRLPLASNGNRSDSFFSRKFFSSKTREKSRDPQPVEALDSWEELKAEDIERDTTEEKESEQHPQSLMSLVADVTRSEPIKTPSPTRVTFADGATPNGASPSATLHPSGEHAPQTAVPVADITQPPPEAPRTPPEPSVHPLSLRDRKTPIIQRPPRKKTPTPRQPIYVPPPPADPVVVTVRSRMQPSHVPGATPPPSPPPSLTLTKPPVTVARPSPLGLESFSSQQIQDVSPTTPMQEPMSIQAPIPARPIEGIPLICRCGSPGLEGKPSAPALSRTPSPLDEATTPTSTRFISRPLPRPPGNQLRPHIDSTFAPNVPLDTETSIQTSLSTCPEGVLIDLGDTPADEKNLPDLLPELPQRRHSPPPLIDLESSVEDISTFLPSEAANPMPSMLPFSGIADLALLFSSLSDRAERPSSSRTNEDVLRPNTDSTVPAAPSQRQSAGSPQIGTTTSHGSSTSAARSNNFIDANIPVMGRVELVRRRVTSDGRVKKKLTMCGVSVEDCGICLSQFKDGQYGSLNLGCMHTFHERCLAEWLRRKRSCPLCRVPLDLD